MSSKRGKAKVLEDAKLGKSLDVRGTPRIFVNGELYRAGSSAESMAKVIEEKLGANAEEAAYRAQAFKPAEQAIKPLAADVPAMRSIAYGELKFSIDSFEGSLDESGKAASVVKAVPGIAMSWYAAKAHDSEMGSAGELPRGSVEPSASRATLLSPSPRASR